MKYFVNTNTGQIVELEDHEEDLSPFQFPAISVNGWTTVNFQLFLLLDKVRAYAFVRGVEVEQELSQKTKDM